MLVIGILGGIASGKSVVAQRLSALGDGVLDADRVGHAVLRLPHVRTAVRERWGDAVFGADGEVDRKALAAIVFERSAEGRLELAHLESLTHPEIRRILQRQIDDMAAAGHYPAVVLDAPVMLKSGWDAFCDEILYVEAPHEVRVTRAAARGWTEEDFAARESAQESLDVKRRYADVIIDNSGCLEATHSQVDRFWQSLFG